MAKFNYFALKKRKRENSFRGQIDQKINGDQLTRLDQVDCAVCGCIIKVELQLSPSRRQLLLKTSQCQSLFLGINIPVCTAIDLIDRVLTYLLSSVVRLKTCELSVFIFTILINKCKNKFWLMMMLWLWWLFFDKLIFVKKSC